MKSPLLHRNTVAALLWVGALGCTDVTAPKEVGSGTEPPAPPAFTAEQAARMALPLEDALKRLLPAAGAEESALGRHILLLAGMLPHGDANAISRQVEDTRFHLALRPMSTADRDALRLALTVVAEAVGGVPDLATSDGLPSED